MNTRLINKARALLKDETATVDQLNTIYGRLKVNNDELNKINEELESHIADEEFVQEYSTVVEYEDNATSIMNAVYRILNGAVLVSICRTRVALRKGNKIGCRAIGRRKSAR
ncbi:hypothetical protein HPB50_014298 [Hyalomma asiaticum]|uniref:Uncharacterized protein n=1 Tax=Hyalomma asiaticum TaxID=266040 RepID=A0ACB7T2I5_HYAAI|nr:hypothetical protein HPB50_014298 [Hyalomma asiaticum]